MRVVHLSYAYGNSGGAAIAATRLHRELLKHNVDSHFVCFVNKGDSSDRNVYQVPASQLWHWLVVKLAHLSRGLWRLTRERKSRDLSMIPTGVVRKVNALKPDIVHIHWVNANTDSFRNYARIKAPVVVHMHDVWMVNGFDSYPINDKRYINGFMDADSSYAERILVNKKKKFCQSKVKRFICPSKWMVSMANQSFIGRNIVADFIYNCIDSRYAYQARNENRTFRILFGADNGTTNPIKGFNDLEQALAKTPKMLQSNICLDIFGESGVDYFIGDIPVHYLGRVRTVEAMCKVYNVADVLALPSLRDNAPQTKFEALMCGTPVVAFDRSGCPEAIVHKVNGYIARDGDVSDFFEGLVHFYGLWKMHAIDREGIAKAALNEFNNSKVVDKIKRVYHEVLEGI